MISVIFRIFSWFSWFSKVENFRDFRDFRGHENVGNPASCPSSDFFLFEQVHYLKDARGASAALHPNVTQRANHGLR